MQADSNDQSLLVDKKSKKNSNNSGISSKKPTVIPASRNWMEQELKRPQI